MLTGTADVAFAQLMAHLSQKVVSEDVVMVPDLQAAIYIFSVGQA